MASAVQTASTSRTAVSENDTDEGEGSEDEYPEENIRNIYLHLCNEEGKEFTGVTTFHGMIRIFTSRNWTSLIFWVIVVSTSLVFFMIFSGFILANYAEAQTFMRRSREVYVAGDVTLSICGSPSYASALSLFRSYCNKNYFYRIPQMQNVYVHSSVKSKRSEGSCLEITATPVRNQLFMHISEDLLTTEMYLLISPTSMRSSTRIYLRSRHQHRVIVKASQISRLNTTRAPCISDLSELGWIVKAQPYLPQNEFYTMKLCERIQMAEWSLRHKECAAEKFVENGLPICGEDRIIMRESLQKEFPCRPPCNSLEWQAIPTYTRIPNGIKISIEYRKSKDVLVEIRKMGVTDVLSFIGGGTSLFLGCSCVTLMETFIFLFKLVLQSVSKEAFESVPGEDESSKNIVLGPVSATKLATTETGGFDVNEEGDAIASTMQSPPRKSIHCVRLLTTEEDEEKEVRGPLYRPHPPSLSELRKSNAFNELNTHNIERSLRNLPLSQRLTFDGAMDRRHLRRQCAVDVTDDKLDQYLKEPTNTRPFCDDFDRKHPARVKVRRISSVTSRGSSSSTRTNVHIVEHPRRRSQIFNKFMTMNDF